MNALEERITLTAKMFANVNNKTTNQNIQVVFEKDATPHTDGEIITLPSNMNEEILWELLGALLHESFHIRFTDMKSINPSFYSDQNLFYCLNVLEDIRINWMAHKLFPKSRLFFHALYYYLAKKHKDSFHNEPIINQIINTLLLSNDDFPTYSREAEKLIKIHDLERFKTIARNAEHVKKLEEPAKELHELLNKISKKIISNLNSDDLAKLLKSTKDNLNEKTKKYSDKNQLNQTKKEELNQLYNDLRKIHKKLHRIKATNNTRSNNLNYEVKRLIQEQTQNNSSSDIIKHKSKLSNNARNRSDAASDKMTKNETELQNIANKMQKINKLLYESKKELTHAQSDIENLLKNGIESPAVVFGYSPISITGLNSLDTNDLCYEHAYELPKSLNDIIREIFLQKKEDKEINNEGNRLNRNNLYKIITDNQNLFNIPIQHFEKTKIAFLLDMSGSMNGNRARLVNTAFAYLYNSLTKVLIDEGLNDTKIGVFGFNTETRTLKNFEENKNGEAVLKKYFPSGGTRIERALVHVINKMTEEGDNQKQIIILLTDADVPEQELMNLRNTINFEDTKIIFIGIEIQNRYNIARELFMDNITGSKNVIQILTNALKRSI